MKNRKQEPLDQAKLRQNKKRLKNFELKKKFKSNGEDYEGGLSDSP